MLVTESVVERVDQSVALDDDLLLQSERLHRCIWRLWEPQRLYVVLGRSSPPEQEVHLARCREDEVRILRRLGGGCSVVLAPGMVVISIASPRANAGKAEDDLKRWTSVLALSLEKLGVEKLSMRGTSDLCIGDRKIMGSCLYRSRAASLYQASLLVNADTRLLERYLQFPIRMPSYRRLRSHSDFVTTLRHQGYPWSCGCIIERMTVELLFA